MKARKMRRHNPVAKAVRTPQYKLRVVQSAKVYTRKSRDGRIVHLDLTRFARASPSLVSV
jgi:hypothetical protein